ncbi:Ima1 N-terminal domain-containing protein [Flagelloscypha sp. PMI_526]|nr:Ima1 N-terminal domain-containing protein [Flagelloscypha sp. PMI_526]
MLKFRRSTGVNCYFCHSEQRETPRDPFVWRCDACSCWNVFDQKTGEFSKDFVDPAMRDETLNVQSFNRRGSSNKRALPSSYPSQSLFCRTCQTNHMMVTNLLSDYLPEPESPEYASRIASLPTYRASLEARYPPVCDSCLPLVQDKIQEKDNMARMTALGGWLKNTQGRHLQRHRSTSYDPPDPREKGKGKTTPLDPLELAAWRIRGVLWVSSLCLSVLGGLSGLLDWNLSSYVSLLRPIFPLLALLSLIWTNWDPTYESLKRAQWQGRDIRQRGKWEYTQAQMFAWATRVLTCSLISLPWYRPDQDVFGKSTRFSQVYFTFTLLVELFSLIRSCLVLRLAQPPAIRLIDTSAHKRLGSVDPTGTRSTSRPSTPMPFPNREQPPPSLPPTQHTEDFLASLTLSSTPVFTRPPVFGVPSMTSAIQPQSSEPDAMDWSPTNGTDRNHRGRDPTSYIRPQTYFPPEEPTGLEDLFNRATSLVDDSPVRDVQMSESSRSRSNQGTRRDWQQKLRLLGIGAFGVALLGVLVRLWLVRRWAATDNVVTVGPTSTAVSYYYPSDEELY